MRRKTWLLALTATVSVPALADPELGYGPAPEWASLQPLVVKPKAAVAGTIEVLLWDAEYRLDPSGIATVIHYAARINDPQALAAGNLSVVWDPAFDQASVNAIRIIRGNETIDPLAKGQKFTILRREQGLEQQTLDGRLTATLQTEGLQVGDVIEVTQTIVHRDPTLKGHVEANLAVGYPVKFQQARIRVSVPSSVTLQQRTIGGLAPVAPVTSGRDRIYQWDLSPLQPDKPAEFAPGRYQTGAGFEMTDFRSWGDLSAILLPHFDKAATIAAASPLRAEIASIKAASPDPKVQAALALSLVESKVRYVNLALGVGGLIPAGADLTWERRFGDCKAKSVLLTAILRELGIDATPVLVNTVSGDGLDQRLPKAAEFDHVIVRAVIGGREYWLDGTRLGDVTLDTLQAPGFRWGLPLKPKAALVPIVQVPLSQPRREKIILTDASAGITKPAPTTIDLIMRGDDAILENSALTSIDPARRDEIVKKQVEGLLDRFVVSKVSTNYDPQTQTYRLHGEGIQTLSVDEGNYWSETPSPGYKADYRRTSPRDPDAPVAVDFPMYSRTVQTLVLPKAAATNYPLRPADVSTTVAGIEYKRTVTRQGGAVVIDSTSRSLVPEISIAEARAAEPELRRLDNQHYRFSFTVAVAPTTAEVSELLGTTPKTSFDYIRAAEKFARAHKLGQAIAMLDKAVELSPGDYAPRMFRGSLNAGLGNLDLALTDIEVVLKARPNDVEGRLIHADLMIRKDNLAAAIADAQALASADNAQAQLARARILVRCGRTAEALAATDKALIYDKDPLTYVFRARLIPSVNKIGRQRELDAAVRLDPKDGMSLGAIAELARQLGHFDLALSLLDKAFLLAPDNIEVRSRRAVMLELVGRKKDADREFDALAARKPEAEELNNMCWAKAAAGIELDRALAECDQALAAVDIPMVHDSRALVLLRLGRFDEAATEYGLALSGGDIVASLYGRSIANARLGKKAQSDADRAKALKLDPLIGEQFAGYGLNP